MFRAALFESGYRTRYSVSSAKEGEPKSPSENESNLQRGSLNGSGGPKMNVFGSSMSNHCVIPIDENYHLCSRLDRHTEP